MTDNAVPDSPAERLEAVFKDIAATRMAGLAILNPAMSVAAVGFRHWHDGWYGVLITPWFMNLIGVPDAPDEAAELGSGTRRVRPLPSGDYEFLSAHEDALGAYWTSSLVSPMHQFGDMATAQAVAESVLETIFSAGAEPPGPVQSMGPAESMNQVAQPAPTGLAARLEQPLSRRGFFSALLPKDPRP
jgi:[NiFe] hydrogenase assembly HybE family chaperone